MHEELTSVAGYVCNWLFSNGEDGFGTRRMTRFCKLFGRHQDPERKFPQIRDHKIYVPKMHNSKADSLERNVRKQPSFVVHMDADLSVWFTKSLWVCINWWQKKEMILSIADHKTYNKNFIVFVNRLEKKRFVGNNILKTQQLIKLKLIYWLLLSSYLL